MKVTVLIENTRLADRDDLRAENGLSLYIQHDGMQILFDTGVTEAFGRNAERDDAVIQPGVDRARFWKRKYGVECITVSAVAYLWATK